MTIPQKWIHMNLRNIRMKKGYTQDELAKICKLKQSRISRYEVGNREPGIETLKKLASALDVTVDELLEDETDDTERIGSQAGR